MEPVRSTRNQRVVEAVRLHRVRHRRETGTTLVEGPHVVGSALDAGATVRTMFVHVDDGASIALGAERGIDVVRCTDEVLARVAGTDHPRGPIAVVETPFVPDVLTSDAVFMALSDPGNAGTVIRTAAAFRQEVRYGEATVDPWSPKVVRAAAGAHFLIPVRPAEDRAGEERSIALVVEDGTPLPDLPHLLDPDHRWVILVGSEAHGLAPGVVSAADVAVTIPMPGGTESLNAAVAAAIVMYELSRWRTETNSSGPIPARH